MTQGNQERAARKQPFEMPGGIYLMTLKLNIVVVTSPGVTKYVPFSFAELEIDLNRTGVVWHYKFMGSVKTEQYRPQKFSIRGCY